MKKGEDEMSNCGENKDEGNDDGEAKWEEIISIELCRFFVFN